MAEQMVSIVTWISDDGPMADVFATEELALAAHPEFGDIEPDNNGDRIRSDDGVLLAPRPVST